MRYWGKNIEIDGSFYKTEMGKSLLPTPAEMDGFKKAGNFFQLEGDAEVYEVTVQNMMRDIEENQIGKLLIRGLDNSPRKLRIIPITSKEQSVLKKGPCAIPVGNYDPKGNECVIWFEPWSRMPSLLGGGGGSPYQVLVHELQHAVRQMRGKWFVGGATPVGVFPNAEEMFSVTIENMYLSAARQPHLMLGAYDPNVPLGDRTDKDFYKQYSRELKVWCKDLPDVSDKMNKIPGIWNPIRVHKYG